MLGRRQVTRVMGYIAAVIFILGVSFLIYTTKKELGYPEYTSYSTDPNGVKVLFLLTEQMGYSADRFRDSSKKIPDGCTVIAVKPEISIFNQEAERKNLREWLQKGNTLILTDEISMLASLNLQGFTAQSPKNLDNKGGDKVYSVGRGFIYFLPNPSRYTNNGLKNPEGAILVMDILQKSVNRKVLFNEYYHGYASGGTTLWDLLGTTGRLVLIQLVLGLILLGFTAAVRFGKPEEVFRIVKREENENLFALSNLYTKAGAYALVLEIFLKRFKKELSLFLGMGLNAEIAEISACASGSLVLKDKDVGGLLEMCGEYIKNDGKSIKRLLYMVQRIEYLRREISK